MRSRRQFLKASISVLAGGVGACLIRPNPVHADEESPDDFDPGGRIRVSYDETASFNELLGIPPMLGRVEARALRVTSDPENYDASIIDYVHYDDVLPLYRAFSAQPPWGHDHNPIWYEIDTGFVHSSWVVPVREMYNTPEDPIGDGFWGEISVPTSWQHWTPKLRSRRYYDLAYSAVFRVIDRADEEDGRAWYRILDDANPTHHWWVQATHVRRISDEEFSPISPDVLPLDKRIEVVIKEQRLTCYEQDTPVFMARIASGTTFIDDEGKAHQFNTPYGDHHVQRKTPTRHMAGGEAINDSFDLPGVPWCTFFTPSGAAIHGTYWHNDYGRPRSHGCINVTPDAARWIYRWVIPLTGPEHAYYWTTKDERENATAIKVLHTRER